MSRVSSVPGWVRPPLRAVAGVEHFLLRLYGRTESPEALAGYSALTWLAGDDGDQTSGPLVWRAPPEKRFADAFLAVADELAEGAAYPPPEWWREQAGCLGPMDAQRWRERAGSPLARFYAHGVVCALGWALGVFADPAIMAPLHRWDGTTVEYGDRAEWRVRLRGYAIPAGLADSEISAWLRVGPPEGGPDRAGAGVAGHAHPHPAGS